MTVDYNLNTVQKINIPVKIQGYDLIQDRLAQVERRLMTDQSDHQELLNNAAAQLFQSGGKRMRAAICLLSAGIFDADLERSISLAAGIEMLHTATLVHDDLIDDALLRRGQPTLNAGQNAKFTVLIGDYFFARAANLVAETDNVSIMSQFARTLMTILNGELTQQFSRWSIDRQNYYDRIYAKTGDLFVLAARAGATLGGADEASLLALESYGYHTGIAFQIIDDILDFTAQQTQLGKPVGSDLRQGLFTLPALLYIERYPDDPDLRTLLKAKDENHSAAENLIASIQASGLIEEALAEARSLVSRAKLALQGAPHSEYTNALLSIADRIVERKV